MLTGCEGLKIIEARIPVYKLRGEDAELSCLYELGGDSLYSVKWYKDDEEFYRYMPANHPAQRVYPRPGVVVHVSIILLHLKQSVVVHLSIISTIQGLVY